MRSIPSKLRNEIARDPYMRSCCIPGCEHLGCSWHHCFIYQGRQISERWAIMPVCPPHHTLRTNAIHRSKDSREFVQYLSLLRVSAEELAKYPKKNWDQTFKYLKKKYGARKNNSDNS